MKHRLICSLLATYAVSLPIFSQEALKSTEEEYYDFLSLQGLVERPTLGYRTLSDSEWTLTEEAKTADENVWKNNSLGSKWTVYEPAQKTDNFFTRGIDQSIKVKIYGPEWYNSYNTAAPYGQNDGALWQGKGYNTSLTAGARLEAYGLEATFKPQLSFSQNREFDIMPSAYDSEYGYFWGYGVDAPQRFGDKSFFTYDWGDTEIRYTWHNLTTGIGTQTIWLGPAWLNPVLHSNNAPSYPKVDFGLRKTEIHMPFLGWDLGSIEGRIWTGYLTESDYFDEDLSNDHNMIHGLSMSYAPSFIPGLTLTANRICLVKWNLSNIKYVIPLKQNTYVGDTTGKGEDNKFSLVADWIFPSVGFEGYGEIGYDDGDPYRFYPERTLVYTVGAKKTLPISKKHNMNGELIFEWSNTEMSQDFQFQYPYSFGMHYQITQGYTNRGQWIGSGAGYGGISIFTGFKMYYPRGSFLLFWRNHNTDNNYVYCQGILTTTTGDERSGFRSIRSYGFVTDFYLTRNILLSGSFVLMSINDPLYEGCTWARGYHMQAGLKIDF